MAKHTKKTVEQNKKVKVVQSKKPQDLPMDKTDITNLK